MKNLIDVNGSLFSLATIAFLAASSAAFAQEVDEKEIETAPQVVEIDEDSVMLSDPTDTLAEVVEETLPTYVDENEVQETPRMVIELEGGGNYRRSPNLEILSPWAPKPLSKTPVGWKLIPAASIVPEYTETVKLSSNDRIQLAVRPYILIPDTEMSRGVAVSEPGYDAALGYAQHSTVGAMLQKNQKSLESASKQANSAIDQLQALLDTLPATNP